MHAILVVLANQMILIVLIVNQAIIHLVLAALDVDMTV
jgi:hypothetical protein